MKSRKFQPRVEALEGRWAPALLVQLDSAGNLTSIFGVPDGDVDITFTMDDEVNLVEDGNDLGTYAVSGDLRVSLGNSAVPVEVNVLLGGNSMSGSLSVRAGNALGGYAVTVDDGTIGGNLTVATGAGTDVFIMGSEGPVTVNGSLYANLGGSSDVFSSTTANVVEGNVTLRNAQTVVVTTGGVFEGNFSTDTSQENLVSVVVFGEASIAGHLIVRTGGNIDTFVDTPDTLVAGNLIANLGGNTGTFIFTGTVLGNLVARTGSGAGDTMVMVGTVGGNLTASTGPGDLDVVTLAGMTVLGSSITVLTGNGDDTFTFSDVTAPGARLTYLGQNGDDTVNWGADNLLASAYLDGGFGTNAFNLTAGVVIDFPFTLRNFI